MSRCSCRRCTTPWSRRRFASAGASRPARRRRQLESVLARLETQFEPTPAGLGITVAWGLPYFRRYVPRQARSAPADRPASDADARADRAGPRGRDALPERPDSTILEENDVAVLLRSDSLDAHRRRREGAVRRSRRHLPGHEHPQGLRRRRLRGGTSLPKQMATAAGVPGAELIPDTAELFLGFTSTQKAALGPPRIANLETLGYADLGPNGLLRRRDAHAPLALFEDLAAWYQTFDFQARVDTTFRPGLDVRAGTQTVAQGPGDTQTAAQVAARLRAAPPDRPRGLDPDRLAPRSTTWSGRTGPLPERDGDSPASRLQHARQPVLLDADPERDGLAQRRRPASISSSSTRRATTFAATGSRWTGCCPTGRRLPFEVRIGRAGVQPDP